MKDILDISGKADGTHREELSVGAVERKSNRKQDIISIVVQVDWERHHRPGVVLLFGLYPTDL